jgi:hypothetical protein
MAHALFRLAGSPEAERIAATMTETEMLESDALGAAFMVGD